MVEDLDHAAIAARLGCSEATARPLGDRLALQRRLSEQAGMPLMVTPGDVAPAL